jgi:hypothetical protein
VAIYPGIIIPEPVVNLVVLSDRQIMEIPTLHSISNDRSFEWDENLTPTHLRFDDSNPPDI